MLPSSQLREVTLKDYVIIVKRRVWVILACFIFITSWSILKTLKKVATYEAIAKMYIESTAPQVTPNIQQVYSTPYFIDKEFIQTQIDILTSRSLAKKIVQKLIASGDTTFVGMDEAEGAFLAGLNVVAQVGTQIINAGYISADPIQAAKFANALANTYIEADLERKVVVTKYAIGWLEAEITDLKKKLEEAENALSEYMKQNKIISTPDIEAKTQIFLDELKGNRVRIENQIVELSKRYKEKHPKMVALKMSLYALNKSIDEEIRKLLELNEKNVEYSSLKREVETNKSLYQSLLRRIKETEVSKDLQTTNIRIIDLAEVPKAPIGPNRKRDVLMGVMLSLVIGFGFGFLLEYLDSTIKNAGDVEAYVKLPFLGYVPSAKPELKIEKDIDFACSKLPRSRIAEAYRSIRTSIIFSVPEDRPLKTILITSTSPQEGKTTVCINLGIVFASANEKTLIIEADMRKPRLTKSFAVENKEGLSSFLAGTATFDEVLKQTSIPNLFFLPSGPRPPNPTELLTSAKSRSLLEEAKTRFDRIIIDSTPILTVADTAILANIVDGVIDIVRASYQNIDLILRGRQRLTEVKARIIGVILNNVNVKKEDSYYYYHYYYAEKEEKKA